MLLIHGEPGVGKTVLAEMLVYRHLDKGYKLKFVTGNKIKELEEIMSSDKKEKEVIFIDDFLGSNFLEIFTQTSENKLIFFLKKYLKKENKKVILTTRTTIYNKGIQQSEALDRLSIEFKKYNLEITSYNILDKAKILYNHLYFNLIPSEYKMRIRDHQEYLRIVEHQNYTPRLIEFITNINRILDINPYDYIKFIFDNLDNPKEIWKNEFENKISDEDRFLVCTLFTFKENVDEHILRNAFEERYNYEVENNNFIRIQNAFNKSLESLSKEFIKINREINNRYIKVSFVNPSINDFLINYLSTNIDEVKRVLNGIKYIDQLEKFKADNKICRYNTNMEKEVKKAIKNIIVNNFNNIEEYKIKKGIYVLEIVLELYKDDNTMKPLIKNILYELIKDRSIKDKENLNILIDLVSNKNINLSDVEDLFRKKYIKEEIRGEEIIFNLIEYFESFAKYVKMIKLNFSYEEALAMLTTRYIYNSFDEICGQTITDFCCDITFYDECGFVDETGKACFDFNGAKSLLEDNFYKYAEDIFSEYEEEFSHFSIYKPMWEMIKSTFEIYYKEKILIGIEEIWNKNYKKNYTSGKHNYNYDNAESLSNRKERIKYYDDIDKVRSMFNRM